MLNEQDIIWDDEDDILWDDPQQLRAGTGSFWGDIKQDAANIFLPERYAAEVIQRQNPGSTIEEDGEGGYILVRADGSRHDLNAPGLGYQDALTVLGGVSVGGGVSSAAKFVAPKLANAAAAFARTNPGRTGMAAGTAYSAAEQGAGEALAPDAGEFSIGDMITMGMFGGAFPVVSKSIGSGMGMLADKTGIEAFRSPIKSALAQVKRVLTPAGELSSDAKKALDAAGIKWQNFTPEQIATANSSVATNASMSMPARGRTAALATEGITPTQGMQTQSPYTILRESGGQDRAVREQAARDLMTLGEQLGPPERMGEVGDALVDINRREFREAGEMFDTARELGAQAAVPGGRTAQLRNDLEAEFKARFPEETVDDVMKTFPAEFSQQGSATIATPTNVRKLFEWRSTHLSDLPQEAKTIFDRRMDDWAERSLIGDEGTEAIKAWRGANDNYRDFSIKWNSNDLVSKAVVKDRQGYALRYDPDELANLFLNSSEAGFIAKPGLRQSLSKLKEIVGEDSPEWRKVGDAMARRALKVRTGFAEGQRQGSMSVNGVAMNNLWGRAKSEAGDILEEVYPPEVMDRMDNFMQYARWMDTKIKSEAQNVAIDNGYQMVSRALSRFADANFRLTRAAFREGAEVTKEAGTRAAMREFYGELYEPSGTAPFKAAQAVAIDNAWQEVFDEVLRDWGYDVPGGGEPMTVPIYQGVSDTQ